ncbi:MAG TPA: SRPBCC domain-containing protein [Thermoplasmata archaeon]|nr:SRPBCC domain-containing protein [Thermoplasmata archaeon]
MSTPTEEPGSTDREFVVERTFHAPAARVFAAYTDPALLSRWWGPKGSTFIVEAMDVRPGGAYRFVQRDPKGQTIVFVGKYLEVRPVTRLVYTFEVEGMGNEIRATVDLKETGGKTAVRLTSLCVSKEARDMMVQYGAVAGAQSVWKQLEELVRGTTPAEGA